MRLRFEGAVSWSVVLINGGEVGGGYFGWNGQEIDIGMPWSDEKL